MSTDAARARAHYKWADRYKVQGEYKKSDAHMVRARHYEGRVSGNMPAFGAARPYTGLVVVSGEKQKLVYTVATPPQEAAVDALIRRELKLNETPGPTQAAGILGYDDGTSASATRSAWVAIRHAGCIYLADFKTHQTLNGYEEVKQANMVLRIRAKINAHPDPCTAIRLQETAPDDPVIMIAEDWRPSMLVVRAGHGAPLTPASLHEMYMYYDFMMTSGRTNPVSRAYCNRAHATLCTTRGKETNGVILDPSDECFEYQKFNELPDQLCPPQTWSGAASKYVWGTAAPSYGYKLEMAGGVVKIEDRVDKLHTAVEVMPVSLVPDSRWNHGLHRANQSSAMHRHWARFILDVPANADYKKADYIDSVFKHRLMEMKIDITVRNADGARIIDRCKILSEAAAILKGETVDPKFPRCKTEEIMALYAPQTEPHEPQTEPHEPQTEQPPIGEGWMRLEVTEPGKKNSWPIKKLVPVEFGNHNRKPHRRTTK
jgi:hypothetical protein